MILTEADKPTYFPLLNLTGAALNGAIQLAQTTAEEVARRPLGMTKFYERFEISPSLEMPLRYQPIDLNQPIVLSINNNPVPASHYTIDPDGILRLEESQSWYGFWGLMSRNAYLLIQYWAGFDFSQNSPEVRAIKSSVAAILYYQQLS